tara:strand:- start:10714 stop:11793 length:1080 start_codon:yes stop_codon:yes gene_type:complete
MKVTPLIITKVIQGIGYLSLNRPAALNALNQEMVDAIHYYLDEWEKSEDVNVVVLKSTSPNFFCAGGDIKALYHHYKNNELATIEKFYTREYALNQKLSAYTKPTIAIGSGLVMGGGLGLVQQCDYRLVTENSEWAMPETAIGFFPDVGAIWFLNKCPGYTGWLMALSGCRANAADIMYTVLGTHFLSSETLEVFYQGLEKAPTHTDARACIDILLENMSTTPQMESPISHFRQEIDTFLSEEDLSISLNAFELLLSQKLGKSEKQWLENVGQGFANASPLSLVVTHQYLKKMRSASLSAVFETDRKLANLFLDHGDFIEGVRAKLIDRDGMPKWLNADLYDVSVQDLEPFMNALNEKN